MHLKNLDEVLNRLEKAGLRLRYSKCAFMLTSIEYLGHYITDKGLQPTDKKVKAIQTAPAPRDLTQLKSFLGLVNYYSKFCQIYLVLFLPCKGYCRKTQWGTITGIY